MSRNMIRGVGAAALIVVGLSVVFRYCSHRSAAVQNDALQNPDSDTRSNSAEKPESVSPLTAASASSSRSSGSEPENPNVQAESVAENSSRVIAEQEARMREMALASTRLIYEDIAAAAGLSSDEAESLIALLVNQQIAIATSNVDPTKSVASAEAYRQLLARNRAEIVAQVGTARAAAVDEYQKSINARFEVEELRRQLDSAGLPITDEQRRALIKTAIEKRAYILMPEFSGAESETAMGQELLARIQQRDQALLQIARSILKDSQVRRYDQYLQERSAAMENSLRAEVQ